jgi:hypothetical protein
MADQSDENGVPAGGADQAAPADQAAASAQAGPAEQAADAAQADSQDQADSQAQAVSAVPGLTTVQLAVYAGWTMAVLYGGIPAGPAGRPPELPTVNELAAPARRNLEVMRLRHLLAGLLPGWASLERLDHVDTADGTEHAELRSSQLQLLNVAILNALTGKPAQVQLAYELGRSLRDTANPPAAPPAAHHGTAGSEVAGAADPVAYQLAHGRIAKLQEWLGTLSEALPDKTAAVVAASLGRWSDFAVMAFGTGESAKPTPSRLKSASDKTPVSESMRRYLLDQGDVWLMLLTGEQATDGLLTPEGYVAAGEAALHRSGVIIRGVIRHYFVALLLIAAALGVILFLAVANLGGAAKVWTSIAAIGCSLGASAQTIASRTSRLAAEAGKPVFAMSEEDAMAWAITTLPEANFTFKGVRFLRRAGIQKTATLSRF